MNKAITLLLFLVHGVNAACPCESLNSYCQYASASSPCPRAGVCHGFPNVTCNCDNCPTSTSACKGCSSPSPGPSPGPSPSPTPGSPCPAGYVMCNCYCAKGDTIYGSFACNCKNYKPLPASEQPLCCGGPNGFDAWCAKQGTPAATNPKCTNQTTSGTPTQPEDYYQYGMHNRRCVKGSCKAYYCDNPGPSYPLGCGGGMDIYGNSFTQIMKQGLRGDN